MPGAAVAAIVGVRRGSQKGRSIARGKDQHRQHELRAYRAKKAKMAEQIIQTFDKDNSGSLTKAEVVPMLKEYSLSVFGEEVQPSADDVEFLFRLCDDKSNGVTLGDGVINKHEVLGIADAWGEFLKQKSIILALIKSHDFNQDGNIDQDELQGVLDEVRENDKVAQVEPQVTAWVFSQADINKNGFLSCMELARALCAYEMWLGTRTQCSVEPDSMLIGIKQDPTLGAAVVSTDAQWSEYVARKQKVLEVLQASDVNGENRYTLQDVCSILIKLGFSSEQAGALVKAIDKNGDAVITVDEFMNWIFCTSADADTALKQMAPDTGRTSKGCCTM